MGGVKRRVLKFGGTSVGTPEALRSAIGIAAAAKRHAPVVLVVSALAGVTNHLDAAVTAVRVNTGAHPAPTRVAADGRLAPARPRSRVLADA